MRVTRGDGVRILVAGGRDSVGGELLAVSDSALILLSEDRIVLVPIAVVSLADFGVFARYSPRNGAFAPADILELHRRSRFPYGMTSAAMTSLLSVSKQAKPDVLGARDR